VELDVRRILPVDDTYEVRGQGGYGPVAVEVRVRLAAAREQDAPRIGFRNDTPARWYEFIDTGLHALVAGAQVRLAGEAEFGGRARKDER
jgi:hypothetical protein